MVKGHRYYIPLYFICWILDKGKKPLVEDVAGKRKRFSRAYTPVGMLKTLDVDTRFPFVGWLCRRYHGHSRLSQALEASRALELLLFLFMQLEIAEGHDGVERRWH